MRTIRSCLLGALVALGSLGGCNAKVATVLNDGPGGPSDGGGNEVGLQDDGGNEVGLQDEDRPLVPASKVDLLLVVDNSASMADKSGKLVSSIGSLLRDVALVGDVHVGVVSTSLGNFGGDVCANVPETNGRAHLRTTGPDGNVVPGAQTGVISYAGGSVDALVSTTEAVIRGVGENGCGLEAQLESMYRFLVQPDPWGDVTLDSKQLAKVDGSLDGTVLQQRRLFLRPDSALVIVLLTDEDDSAVDPRAIGGQGWAFMAKNFPGRTSLAPVKPGTTAPRGAPRSARTTRQTRIARPAASRASAIPRKRAARGSMLIRTAKSRAGRTLRAPAMTDTTARATTTSMPAFIA